MLAVVVALSWAAREFQHQKIQVPERATWVTSDFDSLYHMRRLERMLDESDPPDGPPAEGITRVAVPGRSPRPNWWPAETDLLLNYPEGSPIPWPPYYAMAVKLLVGSPPDDPQERHEWIERRVASLPRWFGVLTSLTVALAAWRLASGSGLVGGPALAAGLLAGALHAWSLASVVYSRVGNGDHHAWISWLVALMFWGTAEAFRSVPSADKKAKADPEVKAPSGAKATPGATSSARAVALGVGVGVATGLALGSWVATLLYVIPLQLALGWLLLRAGKVDVPAIVPFGLAFHLAAALTLLPAAMTSPWNEAQPWVVVNLSWFHVAFLAVGGLVFVGAAALRRGALFAHYPWIVLAGLGAIAFALFGAGLGPGDAIREGFTWLRREDEFMGAVFESRGLFGADAAFDPLEVLGFALLALPLAWFFAAKRAFPRDAFELLPWVTAAPLLFLQAARQVRFSDTFVVPLAVLVGWGLAAAWRSPALGGAAKALRKLNPALLGVGVLALAGAANPESVARTLAGLRSPDAPTGQPERIGTLAVREMTHWLRQATTIGRYSVLAPWTWGHAIEWDAGRASVATNFGTFVGEDSFRDPARFFLTEDEAIAERILEERRSRFVMLTSYLPNQTAQLVRAADPSLAARVLAPGSDSQLALGWYRTMGARLLHDGRARDDAGRFGPSLDFLRLVYVTALREQRVRPEVTPVGHVWESVPGAILEATGAPGDTLHVSVRVQYPRAQYQLDWDGFAIADAEGVASLRVPYATKSPNGEGRAVGPARWRLGDRAGEVGISEVAVTSRGLIGLD